MEQGEKYICKECGWIGTADDMKAEHEDDDEFDSTYAPYNCPNCHRWYYGLNNWEVYKL